MTTSPSQPSSNRRRLYLMRHGEVSYFDPDGKPFHPDTVPLNAEGRSQAEAAARALAAVPLDRVVTSNLLRSQETAAIVSAGHGLTVESLANLREIQPGRLADIPDDTLEQVFVGAFAGVVTADTRFLAGETFGALHERVLACFQRLLVDLTWRHLLIVAHGGVNRALLAHVLGIGFAGVGSMEQDAGCLNIIDVDPSGRCLARLINHTPLNPVKIGLDQTTMERIYLQYRRGRPALP